MLLAVKAKSRKRKGKSWLKTRIHWFLSGDIYTRLSLIVFGLSNIVRGQAAKGLLLLLLEACFITYMALAGAGSLAGLLTLGTKTQRIEIDPVTMLPQMAAGDNSMRMLLGGVVTIFVILIFLALWNTAFASAYRAQALKKQGKPLPGIREDMKALLDGRIHHTLLALPLSGLLLVTVLPLAYMILMAFTNYDELHQPPGNLFTWVGLLNFSDIFNFSGKLGRTFFPVLSWTMVWAVFSTFTCYFLGMLLALLINQKGVRLKGLWRTVFVITIAVPSFVSLMVIRMMLQTHGALNILLQEAGFTTAPLPFFTDGAWARVSVIFVNMWVGIPYSMLITTGILMNIPAELYESARLDGAGKVMIFRKITLPYMLFITTPYLITNFIYNINNFNAIYFLTNGGPSTLEYFKGAGKTDLLVTWLYKLTVDSRDYSYAASIGILIFVISAVLSLLVYRRTGAYKNEESFQL